MLEVCDPSVDLTLVLVGVELLVMFENEPKLVNDRLRRCRNALV